MDNNENREESGESRIPQYVYTKKKTGKTCPVWVTILTAVLVALIVFQTTYITMSIKNKIDIETAEEKAYENLEKFAGLFSLDELFTGKYIYDVDYDSIMKGLMYGYAAYSGDKYARYLSPEEFQAEVNAGEGNSSGIGVHVVWNGDSVYVANVMKGSPAEEAGMQDGDIITKVDGKSLIGKDLQYAVEHVGGEKGTVVTLTVKRGETELSIPVTRGSYTAENVIARTYEENGKKVTYLLIIEFSEITVSQFEDAVKDAIDEGADAFIFDVRDNPGGSLDSIVEILDFLVPKGPIVSITDVDGNTVDSYYSDRKEINKPMVVLTNGNTASAAELFTCALKDYKKAVIIGENTFGKGCGQTAYYTDNGGVVYITTFLYNPPYSDNYDGVGIAPDISVENDDDYNVLKITYEQDLQLRTAISEITK